MQVASFEIMFHKTRNGYWRARIRFEKYNLTIRPKGDNVMPPGEQDGYSSKTKAFEAAMQVLDLYETDTLNALGVKPGKHSTFHT